MITSQPRLQQCEVDALWRHSYFAPKLGDPTYEHKEQVILNPSLLRVMVTNLSETTLDSKFLDSICSSIRSDVFAQAILNHIIPDCVSYSRSKFSHMDYGNFSWHDGLLFRNKRTYILNGPSRLVVVV